MRVSALLSGTAAALLVAGAGALPAIAVPASLTLNATPAAVSYGATVTLAGTDAPGATVNVYFHAAGETGYSLRRILTAAGDGSFATSYRATRDERYYVSDGTSTLPARLTQVAPAMTSPATSYAPLNSTVTVRGTAGAGAVVTLHYHRAGTAPSDYSVLRTVTTNSIGQWARSFKLNPTYRVYASVGTLRTPAVLFTTPVPPRTTCTARPSDPTPGTGGSETIYVLGPNSVSVNLAVHYKTTTHPYTGATNSSGSAALTFSIGHPTAGYRVVVTVRAGVASCSTAFTPR